MIALCLEHVKPRGSGKRGDQDLAVQRRLVSAREYSTALPHRGRTGQGRVGFGAGGRNRPKAHIVRSTLRIQFGKPYV